jgi:thiol-disulfide isomerase/thioredoxin
MSRPESSLTPAARRFLLVFLALAALTAGVFAQLSLRQSAASLETAFPDLEGKPHLLSEWKGKVLVVNFWASWCPPCVEEMPEFARLQTEFGARGLQFVGLLDGDEAANARDFLAKTPVNYPILDGLVGAADWRRKLGDRTGVLPLSAVFSPDGRLLRLKAGRLPRAELLEIAAPYLAP